MPFEIYKRQRAPASIEPAVTIQKRGTFSLNSAAYAVLGSPKAVELLYDRERELIGLRKADPATEHAYVVRPLGKGNSTWLISGMAFTVHYGIRTETAHRWIGRFEDGMLILDLSKPGQPVAATRNASVTN